MKSGVTRARSIHLPSLYFHQNLRARPPRLIRHMGMAAIVLSLSACGGLASSLHWRSQANSVDTVIGDMTLPHEGRPMGVPAHYDWAIAPRIGLGNEPRHFRAMIAAGQVYEEAQGNPATNTRVQIRNIRAFYLSKRDRQWHLLQASNSVEGASYRQDFVNNTSKPASLRTESDGGLSIKTVAGYNFHFWTAGGRTAIVTKDIAGVFTTVQARLIQDDPKRPDDRHKARYVLSMSGDYWLNESAPWDAFKTNGDIAIGRFKRVTPHWQSFNMSSLSADILKKNPPPLQALKANP